MPRYNPAEIEPKWQAYWEKNKTFRCPDFPDPQGKGKLYVLDMFPYPSGAGLHVGHPEGYTATDIYCRYWRMQGKTVLHPMGYDAFGLPAEEYAIRTNTPPRQSTEANIANFTRQLKMLGFSYDWDRALATTDVEYFRWTQWIFLVLFDTWYDPDLQKGRPISQLPIPEAVAVLGDEAIASYQDRHRLAYQDDALVNWCPALGTVLANEEVIDGRSERGDHPVQRIPLRQWMLRITAYADRLLGDLELLDWSAGIKKLQADWIGKSTGAEVDFRIVKQDQASCPEESIRVYTTRPDTLFGATYLVVAPEHPLVAKITPDAYAAQVKEYCEAASFKSDRDRTEADKQKTGVFTGAYAINPTTQQPIPIWVADYVLGNYGTGAIMAVPAHDVRDHEFALKYRLPIVRVVEPLDATLEELEKIRSGEICFAGEGIAVSSGELDGLRTKDAKAKVIASLEQQGLGREAVNYKLRDWLFSRQRFWGEPFPILHELGPDGTPNGQIRAVPVADLPVDLPHLEDYKPHGRPEPPLGKADASWLYVELDGKKYRRETNTMPQWAGSCWYYLRFISPRCTEAFVDREQEAAWMPVDLYIGGAEHAVLHLLYARFWHKVLYDRGYVSHPEPFQKLVNQGMILSYAYKDHRGALVPVDLVQEDDQGAVKHTQTGEELQRIVAKMSKALKNVVDPEGVVREYGADALRLYEMFMGPLEATKPWSMQGVNGVRNFLDRVWRLVVDSRSEDLKLSEAVQDIPAGAEHDRVVHSTIAAVTQDIENLSFNTAIARMMEFVNHFTKESVRPKSAMENLTLMLAPFAPHLAEELWRILGHDDSLAYAPWPEADQEKLKIASVEVPIQVNGKVRAKIVMPVGIDKQHAQSLALDNERVAELLAGKEITKVVIIPGKMVNFVIKS
ncbi:MAG: leucine--tRNA ligase [Planctomycetes bacterium]|nr:leucine--tRNA ligase [Planctomycetota bacterium]